MEFDPETKDMAALFQGIANMNDETIHEVKTPAPGEHIPVIVLPEGRTVQSLKPLLDEWRDRPDRCEGIATLSTLASFIDHANRSARTESVIFADNNSTQPALHAVYDYNEAVGDAAGEEGKPNFRRYGARYPFPLSEEWRTWNAKAGHKFEVGEFAEFIEDRLIDVILPQEGQPSIQDFAVKLELTLATPRQLMELSRGLKINVDVRVENATTLQSGEGRIVFTTENRDAQGQPLRVPGGFAIRIPVFNGDVKYDVPVLLRYRVAAGRITWVYSLYRTDVIFRDAVNVAADEAHAKTGLTVFRGTPEPAAR